MFRSREYLRGGEANGAALDGEVSSVKNNEFGIGNDVKVDRDRTGKCAGGKVRFQADVVAFRHGKFGEARLAFELIHFYSRVESKESRAEE